MSPLVWVNRSSTAWAVASEEVARRAALATLEAEAAHPWLAFPEPELSIVLSDDAGVRELNRQYRGRDKATNVLSFAMNEGAAGDPAAGPLLGDILIAHETLEAEAREQGIPPENHLSHLVVHGVLHLLGYDHELSDGDAERMEEREVAILQQLGVADPYA